jgi:hypothetical protein
MKSNSFISLSASAVISLPRALSLSPSLPQPLSPFARITVIRFNGYHLSPLSLSLSVCLCVSLARALSLVWWTRSSTVSLRAGTEQTGAPQAAVDLNLSAYLASRQDRPSPLSVSAQAPRLISHQTCSRRETKRPGSREGSALPRCPAAARPGSPRRRARARGSARRW